MAFSESDDVVLLMVTFLVYAWCVADDLQLVPEQRDVIVQTSHHGEAIVCSATKTGPHQSMQPTAFGRSRCQPLDAKETA
jgi:hypothetical protein